MPGTCLAPNFPNFRTFAGTPLGGALAPDVVRGEWFFVGVAAVHATMTRRTDEVTAEKAAVARRFEELGVD